MVLRDLLLSPGLRLGRQLHVLVGGLDVAAGVALGLEEPQTTQQDRHGDHRDRENHDEPDVETRCHCWLFPALSS